MARWARPRDVVWLNADAMEIDGASARVGTEELKAEPVVQQDQRVALRFARPLPAGPVTLLLGFRGTIFTHEDSGIFRQQSGGEWYVFTQFEETDARRAFPCVDEPSAKIPWTLSLQIPSGMKAVANTPVESETPSGSGMTLVRFRTSRPLPSYLVAFGVGPFDVLDARPAGKRKVPVRVVVPRGTASEAAYAARISPQLLEVLEDYFGIAYPYEKLDILTIPVTVQFGAMENAGLVTFRESLVLARPEVDGVRRRRRYAMVAAHEFAHQWFGDLVTTAWWNDTWLNEAFATWMQTKVHRALGTRLGDGRRAGDRAEHRRQRRRPDERAPHSPAHRELQRHPQRLRRHHLRQGRVGHPDVRALGRRGHTSSAASAATSRSTPTGTPPRRTSCARSPTPPAGTSPPPSAPSSTSPGIPRVRASLRCGTSARSGGPPGAGSLAHLRPQAGHLAAPGLHSLVGQGPEDAPSARCSTGPRRTCRSTPAPVPDWVLPNAGYGGYYRLQLEGTLRDRLIRSRALDDAEVVGLLGDTEALGKGGALPRAMGLALAARYARAREHHVTDTVVQLAVVQQEYLPGRLAGDYKAWVRRTFGFRALELGFAEKPGEDDEAKLDPPRAGELRRPARGGAEAHRRGAEHRRPLDCPVRGTSPLRGPGRPGGHRPRDAVGVMEVAGRAGDARFHERLARAAGPAPPTSRSGAGSSMASPAPATPRCWTPTSALAASGKLESHGDAARLLTGQRFRRRRTRPSTGGRPGCSSWPGWARGGTSLVKLAAPRRRGPRSSSWPVPRAAPRSGPGPRRSSGPRSASVLGGPRLLAQAEESLDLCIAQRQREVPSLQQFFAPFQPAPRR